MKLRRSIPPEGLLLPTGNARWLFVPPFPESKPMPLTEPTPNPARGKRSLAELEQVVEEAFSEAVNLAACLDTATQEEYKRDHLAIIAAHDRILAAFREAAGTGGRVVEGLEWVPYKSPCAAGWRVRQPVVNGTHYLGAEVWEYDDQPGQWYSGGFILPAPPEPSDEHVQQEMVSGVDADEVKAELLRRLTRRLGLLLAALKEG